MGVNTVLLAHRAPAPTGRLLAAVPGVLAAVLAAVLPAVLAFLRACAPLATRNTLAAWRPHQGATAVAYGSLPRQRLDTDQPSTGASARRRA